MKKYILTVKEDLNSRLLCMNKFLASQTYRKDVLRRAISSIKEETGEINMVAIVLILLIVIALAAIFKESLISLLTTLFERIKEEALKI